MQPVALAPWRVQLSEHHRVCSRLAHIANPELGGFEIRRMYDDFLHEEKKLKLQLETREYTEFLSLYDTLDFLCSKSFEARARTG